MNGLFARRLVAVVMAMSAWAASAQPAEIEGVKLEPTAQVGGAALVLNGAGVRTRAIFKVYVAGLYVPQRPTPALRCCHRRARAAWPSRCCETSTPTPLPAR